MKVFQQILFGGETDVNDIPDQSGNSPYIDFKNRQRYRKAKLRLYDRKCCGTCKYIIPKDYHDKRYYKCKLMGMSYSEATDIRKSCVCDLWEYGREYALDKNTSKEIEDLQ